MSAGARWLLAIVGLLGANAVAAVILLVSANAGGAQVIPAYYERASRYDEEVDQAARNRALGWRLGVAVAGTELAVEVRDASGAPVAGARVTATGAHRAHAAAEVALAPAAAPRAPGVYRAPAPARRGRYDFAITVERGGERFAVRAMVEVP